MKVRKKRKNAGYSQPVSHDARRRHFRKERVSIEETEQMIQDPVLGISYCIVSN